MLSEGDESVGTETRYYINIAWVQVEGSDNLSRLWQKRFDHLSVIRLVAGSLKLQLLRQEVLTFYYCDTVVLFWRLLTLSRESSGTLSKERVFVVLHLEISLEIRAAQFP